MEIELQEITDFIAQHHPFDGLSENALTELVNSIQISYLRRGEVFPPARSGELNAFMIRKGAVEFHDENNVLLEQLGEGDFTADSCELINTHPDKTGSVIEDSLVYEIPCAVLKHIIQGNEAFRQFFTAPLEARLKQTADSNNKPILPSMTSRVGDLLNKNPITLAADHDLQKAAQTMTEQNISSLMITDAQGKLCGILTDRDLRKSVANGVESTIKLSEIMSQDLCTISADTLLLDAVMKMMSKNVHHLPVTRNDELIGLLSTTDITRFSGNNPLSTTASIYKANNLEELINTSHNFSRLQQVLVNSGVDAQHIGQTFTNINDAITCKLIEFAIQALGKAPIDFAWLATGSQARSEMTVNSDQDNALILSDEFSPEHDEYFAELARQVNDGLDACGFIYCPGDAMASNNHWRQPLKDWKNYFREWINQPDPEAMMNASIFFDQRSVYGNNELLDELQVFINKEVSANKIFMAQLAANALSYKPPLGFFRQLVLIHDGKHDDHLNIKHRGLAPIINIARLVALRENVNQASTIERLDLCRNSDLLGNDMAENLIEAFEFLANLRFQHQTRQITRQQDVDNYISPKQLSSLERNYLKDCFQVIKEMQSAIDLHYATGRLG